MARHPRTAEPVTVRNIETSGTGTYEVWVRPGALDDAGALIHDACPAHRYAVITDSQVAEIYGGRLQAALKAAKLDAAQFVFPAGEWNKTREIWGELTDELLKSGYGRDSAIIALGGGVVGDLVGFVAATYMRGTPVVQIPTSLLAMVDSSVGGKTGVDTTAGKNLVGAFHAPSIVIIDPSVLRTLPNHQLAAGLAEALKHGMILDADYFDEILGGIDDIFGRDIESLGDIVRQSVEMKADVVSRDAREAGYRRILNFGHTVAHALEAVSGYELLHGEAVAIGLTCEAALGEEVGVTESGVKERVQAALEAARLPTEIDEEIDSERFLETLSLDKKRLGGQVRYTLIGEIGRIADPGDGSWTHEISDETVKKVLFA